MTAYHRAVARRGKGEGMVRRRADGRWEARYTDVAGRRRSLYAASRAEVVGLLTEALRRAQYGMIATGPRQLLGVFLTGWVDNVVANTRRPRTHERYAGIVSKYLVPELGSLPLAKLNPQHVARLHARLRDKMRPASLAYVHAVLRSALGQALEWHLIDRNPAELVRPPRATRTEMQVLSSDQVRAFLEAASGDPLEALYVVAVTTGMRLGELLGLQWPAVNLEGRSIAVNQSLTRVGGKWWLTEPKTRTSVRSVALTERAIAALRTHRARQAEQRLAAGPGWADHSLVFTDEWGEPLFGAHITERRLRPLLKAARLPGLRFHDLRHTAATLLLAQGTNPKIAAEMLGHGSVQITLDRYSHVLPNMQADAAKGLDELLGGSR